MRLPSDFLPAVSVSLSASSERLSSFERAFFEPLVLSPEPIQFRLVLLNLPLLIILSLFLAHQLITNQSASDKPNRSSNKRADSCMAYCAADDGSGPGTHAGADEPTLLTRRKRRGAANRTYQDSNHECDRDKTSFRFHFFILLFVSTFGADLSR